MKEIKTIPTTPDRKQVIHEDLMPEVQEILWQAEKISGKRIQILPDASVETWASIRFAKNRDVHHIVSYNPQYERHLDYIVAHECGHLLRLCSVPPEQRLVPTMGRTEKMIAGRQLLKEMPEALRPLPDKVVTDLLIIWHTGLVRDVASSPADIRIELWLFGRYLGLRDAQTAALLEQLKEYEVAPWSQAVVSTPRTAYRAIRLIDCALAQFISSLLNEPSSSPFYSSQLCKEAGRLLKEVNSERDSTHIGDVRITNKWVEFLGLSGWFEWRRLI